MEKDTRILFETKEESNERRLEESLARDPHERFKFFLRLCEEMRFFYAGNQHPNSGKNNFIVE